MMNENKASPLHLHNTIIEKSKWTFYFTIKK